MKLGWPVAQALRVSTARPTRPRRGMGMGALRMGLERDTGKGRDWMGEEQVGRRFLKVARVQHLLVHCFLYVFHFLFRFD